MHAFITKKTRQNFADKPLDPEWRPIIRKTLSGNDPGLSSKHHRAWFITHGREFFAFCASPANSNANASAELENPSQDFLPKDFDARIEKRRTIFTPEQLGDLLRIAESLTNYSEKWEPLLFISGFTAHAAQRPWAV